VGIKIKSSKLIPTSIRLEQDILNDIDKVAEYLQQKFGFKISRNIMLEQLVIYATENATFNIDGVEVPFKELI
jgi:hypothetical protein